MGHSRAMAFQSAARFRVYVPVRVRGFLLMGLAVVALCAAAMLPVQQAQALDVNVRAYDVPVANGGTAYVSQDSGYSRVFVDAPSEEVDIENVTAVASSNPDVVVDTCGSWGDRAYFDIAVSGSASAVVTYEFLLPDGATAAGSFTVRPFAVGLGSRAFAADYDGYYILYKGAKAVQPRITGASGVTWASSNPAVAKVSSKGAISFKGLGSCVITATFGNVEVRIPVECTYKKAYRAVANGYADMGTKLTYSQTKRMEKNYRDCSSFVSRCFWDASLKRKLYAIGGTSGKTWSFPAAEQAKWLNGQKKTVAKRAVDPSKLLAGDTVYNTTGYAGINDRYLSIDHAMLYAGNGLMLTTGGYSFVGGTVGLRPYWSDDPSIKLIARPCAEPQLNVTKATLTKKKGEAHSMQLKMQWQKGKVTWKSSNKKVATVNSKGKVVAKKKGKATITAKVAGKTYKCKVTVK